MSINTFNSTFYGWEGESMLHMEGIYPIWDAFAYRTLVGRALRRARNSRAAGCD